MSATSQPWAHPASAHRAVTCVELRTDLGKQILALTEAWELTRKAAIPVVGDPGLLACVQALGSSSKVEERQSFPWDVSCLSSVRCLLSEVPLSLLN